MQVQNYSCTVFTKKLRLLNIQQPKRKVFNVNQTLIICTLTSICKTIILLSPATQIHLALIGNSIRVFKQFVMTVRELLQFLFSILLIQKRTGSTYSFLGSTRHDILGRKIVRRSDAMRVAEHYYSRCHLVSGEETEWCLFSCSSRGWSWEHKRELFLVGNQVNFIPMWLCIVILVRLQHERYTNDITYALRKYW